VNHLAHWAVLVRNLACLDRQWHRGESSGVRSVNRTPLPVETVRDLLGICRSLYRAWVQEGPTTADRRRRLKVIGDDIRIALSLARKSGPGSLGNSAAWDRAERATAALGELVDDYVVVKPLIVAAARQLGAKR
jgi:hypothetical protein